MNDKRLVMEAPHAPRLRSLLQQLIPTGPVPAPAADDTDERPKLAIICTVWCVPSLCPAASAA